MSCENPAKLLWTIVRGRTFNYDIEFNSTTVDGSNYDLTGKVVIVKIGETDYRSGTDAQLAVPTPSNGVAQLRMADADTGAFALQRYSLVIEIEHSAGNTTRYREGVAQFVP